MRKSRLPSSSSSSQSPSTGCWIAFIVLLVVVIVLVIVLTTYPYPSSSYYRDASLHGKLGGKPRTNCTVGEAYDTDLDLCGPVINTPIPISSDIMDTSVRQCSSFFNHMSGRWIASHHNENRGFNYILRRNLRVIHDIVRNPRSGPIYTLYRSCVDTLVNGQHALLDRSQVKHVREHILGALRSHADLPVVFARLASYGFTSPFSLTIEPHPTELKMLPLIRRDRMVDPAVSVDLTQCIRKLDFWSTDVPFEGGFVEYVQSGRFARDTYTMGSLIDGSPADFWKLYLRELNGYTMEGELDVVSQPIWITEVHYLRNVLRGLQDIPLREWKAYVDYSIDYHTRQFVPEMPSPSYFRIYAPREEERHIGMHRLKRDPTESRPSESTCIDLVHRLLPGAVGNAYLAKSGNEHVRPQVTTIVERVRDSVADLVRNTSWLTPQTRDRLVAKVRAIIVRTVHPNYYETEPFLERLTSDGYLRNLNIIRRYFATRNLELWTKGEPNRDYIQRFGAPVTEVNAFYSPVTNTITIFSGILNKPFYHHEFPDVALYAIIGMVAGHEIAHAIDNTGRLFDRDGSLARAEPWSEEEHASFVNLTECLAGEYEAPFGCQNANYGQQTLGEDIADLIGLKAAYNAWIKAATSPPSKQEKQWFFQIFAQAWADSWDQAALCDRVNSDEHAIANFRVDKTLRQMVEFRELFNCRRGDRMVNHRPCLVYGG